MKSVLFVCLGNICRSPAAEGIMQYLVDQAGLRNEYFIDSAGISAAHAGNKADSRMIETAVARGYSLTSRSRPFDGASDFDRFDLIVTMDESNLEAVQSYATNDSQKLKVVPATSFLKKVKISRIPDPYYGGLDGFDHVLDLLEECCENLLIKMRS